MPENHDNHPSHSRDTFPSLKTQSTTTLDDTQPGKASRSGGISRKFSARSGWMRWLLIFAGIGGMMGVAVLMLVLALVLNIGTGEKSVTIQMGADTRVVTTQADTVAALLTEQSITLGEGDRVSPGLDAPITGDMTIRIEEAQAVALTVDDATRILHTLNTRPADVLQEAGITLEAGDRVYLDGRPVELDALEAVTRPASNIVVMRGIPVQILDGDSVIELASRGEAVGDALDEAGLTLYVADSVTPDTDAPLEPGMEIRIERSRPLTIVVDGERMETRTRAETYGEAVAAAGVTLAGLDYMIPAASAEIIPNTSVRVIRVTEQLLTEQEITEYDTIYQADAEMALDTRRVLQAGQNGVIQRTIRARYENGVEVERSIEAEEQTQTAQNQIITYGTSVVIRTLQTPDGPVEYWRKLNVYATSYHPEALGGDNITAIGMTLQKGIVGIDPDIIPYRTNLYVEGYGRGIAADTGLKRANPYWIDLGYSDEDYKGWHWWVDVYLLTPVPDTIDYLLPLRSQGGPVP